MDDVKEQNSVLQTKANDHNHSMLTMSKKLNRSEVKKYVDIEKVEGLLEKYDDISNCQNRNEVKLILIPLVFYKFIKQYREMLNFQYDI